MSDTGIVTPYTSIMKLVGQSGGAEWTSELDRERLSAYLAYENIYWSEPATFRLSMRGTNDQPLYLPTARTICNETAHYLLKGLRITPEGGDMKSPLGVALSDFMKRERFYSKFMTAKQSGVVRGDWIMHMTADPDLPDTRRISINSVDPSSYFPRYNPDDLDDLIGVDLVEQFLDTDNKVRVKRLRYEYVEGTAGVRSVMRSEMILEADEWWDEEKAEVARVILPLETLPDAITTIPVYHFKNIDWQGDPFGRSEIKGFETLMSGINQTMSDEDVALALMGLGVFATDAPTPTDDDGNEVPWEIFPGEVVEHPTGSKFEHVKAITSVSPMLEHVKHITDAVFEGSQTFRTGAVDVQLAESGVALAIKFSPTLAKLEQRDLDGLDKLTNLWYDWKLWWDTYEGGGFAEQVIEVSIGEKLPVDRPKRVEELNNMLDRQVIDTEYYRAEMTKLGYVFPPGMAERVRKEQEELAEARMFESPVNGDNPNGNQSNNRNRVNESDGTEVNSGT